MKVLAAICIGLGFACLTVVLVFVLVGPERFWGFAGKPDLGPVSFEQLERRQSPNDALACPPQVCAAKADIMSARYPVTAPQLRAALANVIAAEPRMTTVNTDEATLTDRYIQRSKWLGFPDTVIVRFFDLQEGQCTLAIYSRSQLGESDLGANKVRIQRWLSKLAEQVAPVE